MLILAIVPIIVFIWIALKKRYGFLTSVQMSCIGCALCVLIILSSVYLATGKDIISAMLDSVRQTLEQNDVFTKTLYYTIQNMTGNTVDLSVINTISLQDAMNAVYPYFETSLTYYIPTIAAAFIPLGGLILYLLSRRVVKAFHGSVTPVPAFSDFKLPEKFGRWSIAILLVAWIGQLAGLRNFDFVMTISLAFFGSIYIVLGMAFLEWWMKKYIKYTAARILIIIVLSVIYVQIFMFAGIFEQVLKIRMRSALDKGKL